jgi:hypothetical protein
MPDVYGWVSMADEDHTSRFANGFDGSLTTSNDRCNVDCRVGKVVCLKAAVRRTWH